MQNDICPITMETLSSTEHIFEHMGIGFDTTALYNYLISAPRFTNPVTRVPFSSDELTRLEKKICEIYGQNSIVHTTHDSDEIDFQRASFSLLEEGMVDWFDDSIMLSRVSAKVLDITPDPGGSAPTVHMMIDIDVSDNSPPTSPIMSRSSSFIINDVEEEEEHENACDTVFPSVLDMYNDSGRERRMCDQLSLLQYLDFEIVNTLSRMIEICIDTNFQTYVWQHTSFEVMETAMTHIRGTSSYIGSSVIHDDVIVHHNTNAPPDFNLEVRYTEKWQIFRSFLLQTLERHYLDSMNDVLNIGSNEFEASLRCHCTVLEEAKHKHPFMDFDWIYQMLHERATCVST